MQRTRRFLVLIPLAYTVRFLLEGRGQTAWNSRRLRAPWGRTGRGCRLQQWGLLFLSPPVAAMALEEK